MARGTLEVGADGWARMFEPACKAVFLVAQPGLRRSCSRAGATARARGAGAALPPGPLRRRCRTWRSRSCARCMSSASRASSARCASTRPGRRRASQVRWCRARAATRPARSHPRAAAAPPPPRGVRASARDLPGVTSPRLVVAPRQVAIDASARHRRKPTGRSAAASSRRTSTRCRPRATARATTQRACTTGMDVALVRGRLVRPGAVMGCPS